MFFIIRLFSEETTFLRSFWVFPKHSSQVFGKIPKTWCKLPKCVASSRSTRKKLLAPWKTILIKERSHLSQEEAFEFAEYAEDDLAKAGPQNDVKVGENPDHVHPILKDPVPGLQINGFGVGCADSCGHCALHFVTI
jgi:hypothetical protein